MAVVLPASLLSAALAGCGDSAEETDERVAIYTAVVREVADLSDEPVEEPPVVFVDGLGEDFTVPLEVQAAMVAEMEPTATLRFIDQLEEAIDDDEADLPVRNDGVLVGLGAITPVGDDRVVPASHYRRESDQGQMLVTLAGSGDRWTVVQTAPLEG